MPRFLALPNNNPLSRLPGILLFCASVIMGLLCYKSYGIGWDEPIQRMAGTLTYDYVFNGDHAIKTYAERDLGTGFELLLVIIERKCHISDSRHIYLMRHLVTHLFFLVSVFCGYLLALRLFKDQKIACLAFVMLAFMPRLYAHSFFNSKDIPFLSAFLIAMLVSQIAFEKNKPLWYLLLGLVCGYATSIRAMGIILVPLMGFLLFLDLSKSIYLKEKILPAIINTLLFLTGFCVLLYVAWPILWDSPIIRFKEQFASLAHIAWNGSVLFKGEMIPATALPYSYLPVWISITVPEVWLAAGIAGFVWVSVGFVRRPLQHLANTQERNFILYAGCFALPLIVVNVLHSTNFDDWRHLYFVYPAFVMLALFAINRLLYSMAKIVVWSVCGLQVLFVAFFMLRNHPHQEVYFNNLVSHDKEYLRKNYDLDYWSCANKQGLEYILANDTAAQINVAGRLETIWNAQLIIPWDKRWRITAVKEGVPADYFITTFREHPADYPYTNIFYEVRVLNSTVLRIYKLHR